MTRCSRFKVMMAWSRSGPTNSSATSSHMPSSTCLPSNSTRRERADRAACAVMAFISPDLPPPGSPAASRFL